MAGDDSADVASHVVGEWFHSHEEDHAGAAVYRPRSFAFPRARRPREHLLLGEGGRATVGTAGPADRTEQTPARWSLAGDQVVVDIVGGPTLRFRLQTHDGAAPQLISARTEGPDDDAP